MTDTTDPTRLPANRGYLSSARHLARIDSFVATEGPEAGSRVLRVVNGGGLEFELHPDRALDVGRVTFDGAPYAWSSALGVAAPGLATTEDFGYLKSFGGGLLSTCGLDTYGDPSTAADGERYTLHGRIGLQPARITRATVELAPDAASGWVTIEAEIRQSQVHGENLLLTRRIRTAIGSRSLSLHDTVTNEAGRDVTHMVLYHLNLGWPLLGPGTRIDTRSLEVTPENAEAVAVAAAGSGSGGGGGEAWSQFGEPTADADSLVYLHTLPASSDETERHTVSLSNPESGLALDIGFSAATLPFLHQWKCLRWGQYVMGIEPANTPSILGRADAEARGVAPTLTAGASVDYHLDFTFGGPVDA